MCRTTTCKGALPASQKVVLENISFQRQRPPFSRYRVSQDLGLDL
jgi:hypothetical protein